MPIKSGFCRTDTDGEVYRREDTLWAVWPNGMDPGVLDYKDGATPVTDQPELWWEGDEPPPQPYGGGGFYPHYGFTIDFGDMGDPFDGDLDDLDDPLRGDIEASRLEQAFLDDMENARQADELIEEQQDVADEMAEEQADYYAALAGDEVAPAPGYFKKENQRV